MVWQTRIGQNHIWERVRCKGVFLWWAPSTLAVAVFECTNGIRLQLAPGLPLCCNGLVAISHNWLKYTTGHIHTRGAESFCKEKLTYLYYKIAYISMLNAKHKIGTKWEPKGILGRTNQWPERRSRIGHNHVTSITAITLILLNSSWCLMTYYKESPLASSHWTSQLPCFLQNFGQRRRHQIEPVDQRRASALIYQGLSPWSN